ncbi:voltage-dependent calcium channel subunit alpha-2/delta-3 [Anabrus simplex]|uniref:voltage-dependent calcium channel subunit alpha-2/delta-3 n=1 Tax=Anabrus simplex TaxID=316456 RepID=UPI0035A32392
MGVSEEVCSVLGYRTAEVKHIKGEDLLREIAWTIQNMTESKISAIRRIMDTAENTAQAHQDEVVTEYEYYNAKNLSNVGEERPEGWQEVLLTENTHFYNNLVNTSFSSVHVPTNVFDKAPELLKAVKWSETLDQTFISNYQMDPSLSWQYFGSSLGFMRQYPATKWEPYPDDFEVDLYDCRTRSWYIEAATSPKDVVILVDNSGSMTGMRREIARHVVNDILDTLGNNDFVNVFNFSEEITNVVKCFGDNLVQATLPNIRELKKGMQKLFTDKIANFSAALNMSFQLLERYRLRHQGATCNQAIMLVTDGVPYNYKEIFKEYNWQDLPYMPVRIFTYLIGREVADYREVKWMACTNRGYFVHLSTLPEVRENVLKYIPVMARPLVLWRNKHPTIWTHLYADLADPKMTDWLWEKKESEEQKEIFLQSRKDKFKYSSTEEQIRKYLQKMVTDEEIGLDKYQLMTSVSMPVLDRRENANITEWTLINQAIWVQKIRETRIANLLGVAGTDVPIKEFQELMMPHKLGVNGYAFIVTNNGFILIHPDLRPVFQGILKPNYNSVDMTEVELMFQDTEPRERNEELLKFRDEVIKQSTGSKQFDVKYHFDKMKRAANITRRYFYTGIENTPFTLVIALPLPYGMYRIHGQQEIRLMMIQRRDALKYFKGNNWRIHPDWIYCRYHYDTEHQFARPEDEFLHFLNKSVQPNWKWLSKRTVTPPEHVSQSHTSGKTDKLDKNSYFCDRDLFLSLVFDAEITESFSKDATGTDKEGPIAMLMVLLPRKQFQERFGVTVSFVATHSGLTRWKDFPGSEGQRSEPHFHELHNRAIDEIWYKRAVDYHYINPHSYVYSVPFDAGDKNDTLVTASHAIFHSKEDRSAPAAVIGFQFPHSALYSMLKNITSNCSTPNCPKTCESEDLECYVLDNNGYIIVSESLKDTGKFFGEVRASVMEEMINRNMFDTITIFDYQAVCFLPKSTGSHGSQQFTPLSHLKWLLEWTFGNLMWMLAQTNLHTMWLADGVYATDEETDTIISSSDEEISEDEEEEGGQEEEVHEEDDDLTLTDFGFDNSKATERQYEKMTINRTRPQPCDKIVDLYQMRPAEIGESHSHMSSSWCNRPFEAQLITYSNMVLVVVDALCTADEKYKLTVHPREMSYNGSSIACYKVHNTLPRMQPKECISKHPEEKKIKICGGCSTLQLSLLLLVHCWLAISVTHTEH